MSSRLSRSLILRSLCIVTAVALIGVICGSVAVNRLNRPLAALRPQTVYAAPATLGKPSALAWPGFGQAAIGIAGHGVLAVSGAQTPAPTASSAKLITALAVLRVKPIAPGTQGATLTLSQRDVDFYNTYAAEDGSVAAVNAGEQITEYQVLEGMLLPSANNLADSLAVWAFGSLGAYSSYANHMVSQLQLTQTHVGNDASGFNPSTTSTAADLVRIGELAEANPVLAGIASMSSASIPVAGTIHNVNWLLGTDGISGIKTGNSNEDRGVFVFAAPYTVAGQAKITIIGAVMKAPALNQAMDSAVPLLKSAQRSLSYSTALAAGQAVGQYDIPWAGKVTAVTTEPVQALTWQGKPLGKPAVTLRNITAPKPKSFVVGTVSYGPGLGGSSQVKLVQPVNRPSDRWRLFHN